MSIGFNEESRGVLDELLKEDGETNWMTLGYESNQMLKLTGSGTGGHEECTGSFGDEVVFAFIKVIGTDKEGGNKRIKFALISYVPEAVTGLKKARCSMHFNDVKKFFRFQHVIMQVGGTNECRKEDVINKLNNTGGSDTSEVWNL